MSGRTPKAPAGLGSAGRSLWRRVVGGVVDGWNLDERDLALLGAACKAADNVAELEVVVARDGLTTKGSTGQPVVHPALVEARQQRQLVAALLAKVEIAPPRQMTRSPHQRDQLADARRKRWPRAGGMVNG